MTEPATPTRGATLDEIDAWIEYAGDQANARRDAERRIERALALCRNWDSVADEYRADEERAEGVDPRDFSVVPVLIARIRDALTRPTGGAA